MRFLADRKLMLVLAALVWLEYAVLPYAAIRMVKPDLFFVFLAFYAFRVNSRHVVPLAFVLGLARDLLTNTFFGLETASFAAGAAVLKFLAVRLDRDKRWIQLGSLFLFAWAVLLIFSLFLLVTAADVRWGGWWVLKTFLIAVYTTAVGGVLMPLLERWLRPQLRARQYELF